MKTQFLSFLDQNHIHAAIFDLDGTILDNNSYHLRSWLEYLSEKHIEISEEEFGKNISGRTNKDAVEYIFGKKCLMKKPCIIRWKRRPFTEICIPRIFSR